MTTAPLSTPVDSSPPQLDVVAMTKRFGSFTALDRVSMSLKPGSVNALLGENGAGKSTLVKCVMGFYRPTAGEVKVNQTLSAIKSPKDAHTYGIGMVYQHFTSIPAMTVAENLVLSRPDTQQLINWKRESRALREFIASSPFQIDLDTPVAQLAAGQKQKLEILKQLYLKNRILILDEPTSVLTPAEADEVLGLLRQEVVSGNLSILLITHKFREVQAFADEVTILRKGKLAGQGTVSELSVEEMAQMMLGQAGKQQAIAQTQPANSLQNDLKTADITPLKPAGKSTDESTGKPTLKPTGKPTGKPTLKPTDSQKAQPTLSIQNIQAEGGNGLLAVKGVSLSVQAGEIVGIAGVSGNGQKELVEVLSGQRSQTAGQLIVNGEPYGATRTEMFRHQVCTLPEEPLRNACVPNMSVAENMALRTFDRPPQAKWNWLLLLGVIRRSAVALVKTFSVKTPSVETPVGNLSGGNVQRTVLARELADDSVKLLIAANPCFGLDFSAVDFIHGALRKARNRGVAILLVSEDLDELLEMCDRIFVISDGNLVYESNIDQANLTLIGQKMAGH
ncbi:MAG: ABC transporter ATP-binding protein [Phormidesmis sp.]